MHLPSLISSLIPPGSQAFLVGGIVRDLLLGRPTNDVDIATDADPEALARAIAARLGGTSFALDAQRGVYRAVLPSGLHVDVSGFHGDIESDLRRRDFTINAMALPVGCHSREGGNPDLNPSPRGRGAGGEGYLIDPTGGRADLEAGLIRAVSEENLVSDPLRLLRAFRLSSALGFRIEEETLRLIEKHAGLITETSAERVRDEIYLILNASGAARAFRAMWDAGLLRRILPETAPMEGLPQSEPHRYDLLNHSMKAMEYAEDVVADPERYFGDRAGEVREYLAETVDGGLTMAGLVKFCALLHDTGKPSRMSYEGDRIRFTGHEEAGAEINGVIAERLKLSNRAADVLEKTARHHMRPLHMTKGQLSRHALYRYARDVQPDLPASLIVALGDAFATRKKPDAVSTDIEGVVLAAAEYYYGEFLKEREKPLVRGQDLIAVFGMKPGPVFGRILEEVEEKRAEGVLKDREDALSYIRQYMKKFSNE